MREKQLNLWEFQQVTTRFAPSADERGEQTQAKLNPVPKLDGTRGTASDGFPILTGPDGALPIVGRITE